MYKFTYNNDDYVSVKAKSEKSARKKLSKLMGFEWDRATWMLV